MFTYGAQPVRCRIISTGTKIISEGTEHPRRINPTMDPISLQNPMGFRGNESTNGSYGSALFSLYVLISILVNTREELYTTIISYRIPIVGPNQIRWKILH